MSGVQLKHSHIIEIEPASQDQVKQANPEDWITIESDLGEISKELREISSCLHLRYNAIQKFYAIYAEEKGKEYLVGTYKHLDRRVTQRIRQIMDSSYNFVEEMVKGDEKVERESDYKMDQKIEENAERLAFTIRKELGIKDKVFLHGT